MKGFVLMLLMITCLLALSAGSSFACGIKHDISITETKHTSQKKANCQTSDHKKSSTNRKKCGHSCDGSGCSCAHSPSVFALKTNLSALLQKPVFTLNQVNAWFFKESSPLPVYLSLWMPPNINW